jgi:protein transport protein SEC24
MLWPHVLLTIRILFRLALSIHTFYGSGFVRSVDLLVLPNINPDAAFGIQVSIDDTLANYKTVTFQAALLYTSSKGKTNLCSIMSNAMHNN